MQKHIAMSEEKNDKTPNEQPSEPKKPKILAPKKNTVSDFSKNKNRFLSPKPGTSKMKGGGMKGGGMKKGK
jgi:hypothetical protein